MDEDEYIRHPDLAAMTLPSREDCLYYHDMPLLWVSRAVDVGLRIWILVDDRDDGGFEMLSAPLTEEDLVEIRGNRMPVRDPFVRDGVWFAEKDRQGVTTARVLRQRPEEDILPHPGVMLRPAKPEAPDSAPAGVSLR